jgi:hypothetical protein
MNSDSDADVAKLERIAMFFSCRAGNLNEKARGGRIGVGRVRRRSHGRTFSLVYGTIATGSEEGGRDGVGENRVEMVVLGWDGEGRGCDRGGELFVCEVQTIDGGDSD